MLSYTECGANFQGTWGLLPAGPLTSSLLRSVPRLSSSEQLALCGQAEVSYRPFLSPLSASVMPSTPLLTPMFYWTCMKKRGLLKYGLSISWAGKVSKQKRGDPWLKKKKKRLLLHSLYHVICFNYTHTHTHTKGYAQGDYQWYLCLVKMWYFYPFDVFASL